MLCPRWSRGEPGAPLLSLCLAGHSSSDADVSAFGLLSGEQATVLAAQEGLRKVFAFGIKRYLQGSNYTHWLIFLQ